MLRVVLLLSALSWVLPATAWGQAGLRFDPQRGVVGTTRHKRQWLQEAMRASITDADQLRDAHQRLSKMTRRQIDVLANQLWVRQWHHQRQWGAPGLGFAPVITWLPSGTSLGAAAVVSPDGRYVRVTASPFFSSIPYVDTFNFVTGRTTRYYSNPYLPPGFNHMPPQPPSAYAETWYDGLRTRVGPRPPRRH